MNKDDEFIEVRLPKKTIERVREIVELHDGLYEDENDYINHCVISYNRNHF